MSNLIVSTETTTLDLVSPEPNKISFKSHLFSIGQIVNHVYQIEPDDGYIGSKCTGVIIGLIYGFEDKPMLHGELVKPEHLPLEVFYQVLFYSSVDLANGTVLNEPYVSTLKGCEINNG